MPCYRSLSRSRSEPEPRGSSALIARHLGPSDSSRVEGHRQAGLKTALPFHPTFISRFVQACERLLLPHVGPTSPGPSVTRCIPGYSALHLEDAASRHSTPYYGAEWRLPGVLRWESGNGWNVFTTSPRGSVLICPVLRSPPPTFGRTTAHPALI